MVARLGGVVQQPSESQQPRFTTGVELVQIDVSVLNREGNPVRGLTQQDFMLLENGKPQQIRGFIPIELPPPIKPTAPWVRDVAPDVVENTPDPRRLVVILMDDATSGTDEGEARLAKQIARTAVDQLGPADLAAVVFTYMGRMQNFTAARRELFAAIDSYTPRRTALDVPADSPARGIMSLAGPPTACWVRRGGCVVSAMETVATFLRAAPPGRKLLIYIGSKPDVRISATSSDHITPVTDMFRALHEANVEVNAFDAGGLKTFMATAVDSSQRDTAMRVGESRQARDNLRALAENTGGLAVTDTNVPDEKTADIFRRNSAYYLLGFQSSDSKSTGFRRIEVSVNRPGADVRTRSGYYRTKRGDASRAANAAPLDRTLANGVAATDVPIQVNAASLPTPGKRDVSVIVTAGLRQSSDFAAERVTVAVAAFDTGWKERARHDQTFDIPARPPEAGTELYDVHSRLLLKPGRYELRVAAESRGRSGSVIKSIDVPDFDDAELALSSVLIERSPAIVIGNAATDGIVPIVPTSARVFASTGRAAMLVRVSQGDTREVGPVSVRTRIVDARNVVAFEQRAELTAAQFASAPTTDHRVAIPLDRLAPGDYLLEVEASAGQRKSSRDARFTVK